MLAKMKTHKKWIISALFLLLLLLFLVNYEPHILDNYQTSNFRSVLEIVYFLSSPLLFIIAVIGLQQLSISKINNQTNARRDAFKLAAEQCNYYLNTIIPKLNSLDVLMKKESIRDFGSTKITIQGKHIKIENNPNEEQWDKILKILGEILDILNCLESFSVFFVSGIAEKDIAFSSVGHSYCNSVRDLLPIFCPPSIERKGFMNILKLYITWNDELEKQQASIELAKVKERLKQDCVFNIKSIGT